MTHDTIAEAIEFVALMALFGFIAWLGVARKKR